MFKKLKGKDNEVDITSLNQILRTGKNITKIVYFMAIVSLVLLGTYLVKEWKILKYIGELLYILSPIFIGALIAWFFDPLVSWLQRRKIPRVLGCIIVYIFLIGILFLTMYLLIPSLFSQIKDFVAAVPAIFDNITNFALGIVEKFDNANLINIKTIKKDITKSITDFGIGITSELPRYVLDFGKGIFSTGFNFILGLMVGFYLLFDFDKVNNGIHSLLPDNWKAGYKELMHRINTSLRNYVQGVLIVMFLVFITQSIGLTLAGMEAPILFALFCAVTDIIPYFGPYIGAIPAIIVGFTISPITGICVVISIVVVQLLENNFYQPLIMGHTMKLHPVTIMGGLLVFQHFFGILGMIIATPCIASIKVIFQFIMETINNNKLSQEKKKSIENSIKEV